MVGMPHMITKGPELSVMDDHYSSTTPGDKWIEALIHLEATNPGEKTPANRVSHEKTLASFNLDVTGPDEISRRHAFDEHWFGYGPNGGGAQSAEAKKPTGWWTSWQGDAEEICRQALICAIRLSLRLPTSKVATGAVKMAHAANVDPIGISFRWACGAPTFEAYIEWDTRFANPRVIVTFSTPPNNEKIWLNFLEADLKTTPHEYKIDPDVLIDSNGIWLVAHERTYKRISAGNIATPVPGELNLTSKASWLSGSNGTKFSPIVTVGIPEIRGGVSAPPRPWKQ